MQYIYSIQNDLPNNCPEKYYSMYALKECNNILKFLILLDSEKSSDISRIIIFGNSEFTQIYKEYFRNFSPYVEDYEKESEYLEIKFSGIFIRDLSKISKDLLERSTCLINRSDFMPYENIDKVGNNSIPSMIYLTHTSKRIKEKLKRFNNCEIVADASDTKFPLDTKLYYINKQEYINVAETLGNIN